MSRAVKLVAWEEASEALATYPVVISTVPGKAPLFSDDVIARDLARRSEPLLLIDLGMPPAFARPEVGDSVRYIGVDERGVIRRAPTIGRGRGKRCEGSVPQVWRRLTAPDRVGAVIAAMVEQAETAVTEEVQRFVHRLSEAEDPERVLRQLAHTVARRVLHPPISFVSSTERGSEAVEVLAEAFGVDDD